MKNGNNSNTTNHKTDQLCTTFRAKLQTLPSQYVPSLIGDTRGTGTPLFGLGYCAPRLRSEESAVDCCQQKQSAKTKLH